MQEGGEAPKTLAVVREYSEHTRALADRIRTLNANHLALAIDGSGAGDSFHRKITYPKAWLA
jgi:hypothetical protein